MDEKLNEMNTIEEKDAYDAPRIIQKREIVIELQTNVLPDEPPPPL